MPTVNRSALVRHSARAMFDLVNDFERYPEFLSGCSNAELLERDEDHLKGRLTLSKAGMQQSFVTRNDLYAPERIELNLVDGPFKRLQGTWLFTPLGVTFPFPNPLLSTCSRIPSSSL